VLVSILHRMILWELVKVFFLSFTAITGIVLMGGLVAEATQQGLGPFQVLTIIPLFIPSLLPYILPTSTLFATCVVYGRLAADNEILAIKAAGVNIMKVVGPGVFLGLVMSCVTLGLYYHVIPYTHLLMRTMFLRDVEELLYSLLKKDRAINNPRLDFLIFVHDVQGRKLIDATFQHRAQRAKDREKKDEHVHDFVIRAREAELVVDMENSKLVVKMYDGEITDKNGANIHFPFRQEVVDLPALWDTNHIARPRDMTWPQLTQQRDELRGQIGEIEAEMSDEDQLNKHAGPHQVKDHADNLDKKKSTLANAANQIDAELEMRPALSFGCLCFVLVGCPVGIWFSRSDYLSAFITCFLPIVFVYYPLMLCGTNFAKDGKFYPAASIWAADALVALVGAVLFTRLLKN
jgi:lipopolysaccharide export system permease protein